jgi:hypothetical protein
MGQQQLLLIVISVVIVGAVISSGILLFNNRAKTANREAIIQDMYNIASLAIAFYKTPDVQGGGGGSWDTTRFMQFCGYPLNSRGNRILTDNGQIRVTEDSRGRLKIFGYGKELGYDEDKAIRARLILYGSELEGSRFTILN